KSGNQSASQPISSDFSRTKVIVASSAAALVSERMYNPTPSNKSTHHLQFFQRNFQLSEKKTLFSIFTTPHRKIQTQHPTNHNHHTQRQ
ncbi:hypothetical protein, partial [Ciceribacter azotifigens]|uniref:hypothetical protein n=1 Tax=Ciceribacter azotifigens TaxID=2069303 RepID=UPI003A868546